MNEREQQHRNSLAEARAGHQDGQGELRLPNTRHEAEENQKMHLTSDQTQKPTLTNNQGSNPKDNKSNKHRLEEARRNNPGRARSTVNNVSSVTRMAKEARKKAKKVKLEASSLMKYVDPFLDWAFGIALSCAILKDILDLVFIGSLPVIGTLLTFFASCIIFFCTLITGSGAKKNFARRIMKKYGTIIIGTLIEFVFGIDFLPIETCIVIIVYALTLHERFEEEQEKSIQLENQENYA